MYEWLREGVTIRRQVFGAQCPTECASFNSPSAAPLVVELAGMLLVGCVGSGGSVSGLDAGQNPFFDAHSIDGNIGGGDAVRPVVPRADASGWSWRAHELRFSRAGFRSHHATLGVQAWSSSSTLPGGPPRLPKPLPLLEDSSFV